MTAGVKQPILLTIISIVWHAHPQAPLSACPPVDAARMRLPAVADQLLESGIAATVLELNPQTAAIARNKGLEAHMVDATSADTIAHIGITGSCLVVVTVPDPRSAAEIIKNIRHFSPQTVVIARSRYHVASASLRAARASLVEDEENTIGDELAREVMASVRSVNREPLGCALAGVKP